MNRDSAEFVFLLVVSVFMVTICLIMNTKDAKIKCLEEEVKQLKEKQ